MKNILLFILFVLIVSCKSNDAVLPEEEKDTTYSFVKIEYDAQNDSTKFSSFPIPTITYINGSSVAQDYPFDPGESFVDVSDFDSEDAGIFEVEGIEVFVPEYIDENNVVSLDSRKWKFTYAIQKQKSTINFTRSISIPPFSIAIIESKMFFRKYKTNYKLFMRGDQTGTIRTIEGIWTGIFIDYTQVSISAEEYK
jgi:hypothetical protein